MGKRKYKTEEEAKEAKRIRVNEYRKKNRAKITASEKKWRKKNREKVNANMRRYRKTNGKEATFRARKSSLDKIMNRYKEFMKDKKCERCPCDDYRVLVWHHKDPNTKEYEIYTMLRKRLAWYKILAEIAKCECLCQNCHKIEHYKTYDGDGITNYGTKSKDVTVLYKLFMQTQKCNKCPTNNPGALEWHHKDPSTKEHCIADMVVHRYSWEDIMKEIAKCECLCRKCHHIETHYKNKQ